MSEERTNGAPVDEVAVDEAPPSEAPPTAIGDQAPAGDGAAGEASAGVEPAAEEPASGVPTSGDVLSGRMAIKARQVKPGQAHAVEVKEGQLLQITDVQGKQVADFVAFLLADRAEFLSTAATRSVNGNVMIQKGMKLYSNRRTPLFEVVDDTVGRHDTLFAACDPKRYEELGEPGHDNCRTALAGALASYDVDYDRVPDPINWFMNVAIRQRGELEIREPLSERNDRVVLRAAADVVVAVSACPQDKNATNGYSPSDILLRVYR